MLNELRRNIWGLHRYQKLLKVPRQYANEIRPELLTFDDTILMGRSSARSPDNARALLKRHGAEGPHALAELLPDQRYRRNPAARFRALLRRIGGGLAHNPDHALARELRRAGHINKREIHARVLAMKEYE